jgi:SEL1 protein
MRIWRGLLSLLLSVIASGSKVNSSAASPTEGTLLPADNGRRAMEMYTDAMHILNAKHPSTTELNEAVSKLDQALQLGHATAPVELSKLLFFGRANFEPDYMRCAQYLEQCVASECHFLLGLFYSNGLGGKARSISYALSYYGLAAQRLNSAANMALGWAYSQGRAVSRNCFKSRDYYFPVAEEMARQVETERIRAFPKQPRLSLDRSERSAQSSRDVVDFYQYNADSNDASSLFFLGQVFYLAIGGVERDVIQARRYFEQASKLGNPPAMGYLGQMDFYGEGIEKPDYRRAYHNFRRAAKEKTPTGLNGMGLLYWKGIEVVADLEEAARYFKQAADLDHAEAAYNLGRVYSELNSAVNEEKIFSAYLQALRGGFILAGFELAKINMQKDLTCGLAKYLLSNMLEKHPSMSLIDEGNELFYKGHFMAALSRYLYLAEQGSAVAQYNAAFTLDYVARRKTGEEAEWPRRRALVWYSMAADQGDVPSLMRSGDFFYYGISEPAPVTAAAYYYKAIEKKNAQAAFNLAYMHEHGIGVPQDYSMAGRYYKQAIELGKATNQPQTWFPAGLALNKMRLQHRWHKFRRHLRALPPWTVTMATAIIFGAVTILLAVFRFRLGRRIRGRDQQMPVPPAQRNESPTSTVPSTETEPLLPNDLQRGIDTPSSAHSLSNINED